MKALKNADITQNWASIMLVISAPLEMGVSTPDRHPILRSADPCRRSLAGGQSRTSVDSFEMQILQLSFLRKGPHGPWPSLKTAGVLDIGTSSDFQTDQHCQWIRL